MRVPDDITKTVVFLGIIVNDEFKPKATGFIVEIMHRTLSFTYIVTADHVVAALRARNHDIYIRINLEDGSCMDFPTPHDGWITFDQPDATDVIAAQVAFMPGRNGLAYDNRVINIQGSAAHDPANLVNGDTIKALSLGIGDEVIVVGLFTRHHGKLKNVPIVRVGNIAAMPEEPVKTKEYGYVEAYLIEAHSIGGLSGSPVFVNMPLRKLIDGVVQDITGSQTLLLRLVHGHFDVTEADVDVVSDAAGSIGGINSGVGVVIPATKILELLNSSLPTSAREVLADQHFSYLATVPDIPEEVRRSSSLLFRVPRVRP